MTYASLQSDIQKYLQRTDADTIAQIPNFIFLAQHKLTSDLETMGIEDYVNGLFVPGVSGGAVLSKPGRWRRSLTFNYGSMTNNNTRTVLQYRSYEYLINYFPDRTQQGPPIYYADYGFSNWLVAPTPDQAYPYEISMIALPEPLSISVQTNWYTNYVPHLLLYGSLLQAQGFVRNSEMLPVWQQWYDQGVGSIRKQNSERIYDRGSKRNADA